MHVIDEAKKLMEFARGLRNQSRKDLPMQVCFMTEGKTYLIQGLDEDLSPQQRGEVLRSLRNKFKPYAVIMVYEAWWVTSAPGTPRSDLPADLSTAPNAVESMVATVETVSFRRRWVASIQDGLVGEFEEFALGAESGPLTGLLYIDPVH